MRGEAIGLTRQAKKKAGKVGVFAKEITAKLEVKLCVRNSPSKTSNSLFFFGKRSTGAEPFALLGEKKTAFPLRRVQGNAKKTRNTAEITKCGPVTFLFTAACFSCNHPLLPFLTRSLQNAVKLLSGL